MIEKDEKILDIKKAQDKVLKREKNNEYLSSESAEETDYENETISPLLNPQKPTTIKKANEDPFQEGQSLTKNSSIFKNNVIFFLNVDLQ